MGAGVYTCLCIQYFLEKYSKKIKMLISGLAPGWWGKRRTLTSPLYPFSLLGCFNHKHTVLICLSCYKSTPETGWLINNRKVFLAILEAGKSKMKAPADLVSDEGPFLFPRCLALLSLCPHVTERASWFSRVSYKDTHPIWEGSTLRT